MRDLLITLMVFISLPVILGRPYIGILVWSWLGYMNPHRLAWGWAYDFPFAQVVAVCTLAGLLFYRERRALPWSGTLVTWLILIMWMNLTTLFAYYPDKAWAEWDRTMKIQLVSLLTVWLMQSRERIHALVWVIAGSLGFYGLKGGVFAILTGGNYRVWGPPGSFIEDNNAIGLALVMTLPLMRYLQLQLQRTWQRLAMTGLMLITGVAILSTQSRGALLAVVAMSLYLLIKSKQRLWLGLALLLVAPLLFMFMPEAWHQRMMGIGEYQQDSSAMGRINAWWFAYRLALDRPLVGGGFQTFSDELFQRYAPDPTDVHDAHSIYFEMLGEQGFVGLFLFLLLGFLALRAGAWVRRTLKRRPDITALGWAGDLAGMLQVSIIGYAVGGAFLGLAYFDLYYHLVALLLLVRAQVQAAVITPAPAHDRQPAASATAIAMKDVQPAAPEAAIPRKP